MDTTTTGYEKEVRNEQIMIMTETAIGKWRDLMGSLNRDADTTHLRLSIKGGGCSGFMKELDFCDAKDITAMDIGNFDFVTALCSLYYLDEESMYKVVRHVHGITDTFVLQCNISKDRYRSDPRTYKKASVEYTMKLLNDSGFTKIKVINPYKYSRPLIIAHKGS